MSLEIIILTNDCLENGAVNYKLKQILTSLKIVFAAVDDQSHIPQNLLTMHQAGEGCDDPPVLNIISLLYGTLSNAPDSEMSIILQISHISDQERIGSLF